MSLGSSFLKAAIAPLNFANVSLMGRLITSGLRELSSENLMKQLRVGIDAAAESAGVRPSDIQKLLPMARFGELARKNDGHQKHALAAWEEHPVESISTGDLARLTEEQNLPALGDSLMRLAMVANANPVLRMALYEMSHIAREWQQLVLEAGNKLEEKHVLARAFRWRALRRSAIVLVFAVGGTVGFFAWQRVEQARTRVGAWAGDGDACVVYRIEQADLKHARPEQLRRIEERKTECTALRARLVAEKELQERKDAYARGCEAIVEAVSQKKAPVAMAGISPKLLDFAKRVATQTLELSDLAPPEPAFPCAETDGLKRMLTAFDHAVVDSNLWLNQPELSARARAALDTYKGDVALKIREDLNDRAEKLAIEALIDRAPLLVQKARHQCGLKLLFGLKQRAFCAGISK